MRATRVIVLTGMGALLLLAASCSSNKTAENSSVASSGDGKGTAPPAAVEKKADQAMVRFINGTTTSKDLAFGDTMPFTGVDARDVTAYKLLPAERHEFKLLEKGNSATPPLATDSEGLTAGKHYTVLAVSDKSGKQSIDNISDDLTPPAAGQAKVRVINLAPGVPDVDLYAGQKDAVISGAGLDHPTDYKDVNPSEAELTVRHGMSKRNAAPVKDMTLEAGKLYTILVFQDRGGKLKVKTIKDEFTAAPNGTAS